MIKNVTTLTGSVLLALVAFNERLGLCVSRGKTMTGFDTYRA